MEALAVTIDQAREEGRQAFRDGLSGSRKPYPTTTPQGQAWVDGWLEAQGERAEAERNGTWNTPASEASANCEAAGVSGNALHERSTSPAAGQTGQPQPAAGAFSAQSTGAAMKVTKVKHAKGDVEIRWTAEEGLSSTRETKLKCTDTPRNSFSEVFQGFKPLAGRLLELPESWLDEASVIGVSINHESDERRGLVVTLQRSVESANSPVTLNTPHVREQLPGDDDNQPWMDGDLVEQIEQMDREAQAYVNGDRQQGDMFAGGQGDDKPVADSGAATGGGSTDQAA
ncbi:MAG: hypothetical protein U5L06_00795 [Rhodovibrio sp.]|nr:hypothetical protein [Rhodovibrio sp.]